jgi:hypothetical protein|tara:strand:+ start:1331 stop:2203 length:873 start_codon:yes stop_codon:yes gene_type:complete
MSSPRRRKIRKHMVGRAFAKRSASGSLPDQVDNFIKGNSLSTTAKNGVTSDMDDIMLRELYGEQGVNGNASGEELRGSNQGNLDSARFFDGQTLDLGKTPLLVTNGALGSGRKTTEALTTGSAVGVYIMSSDRLAAGDTGVESGSAVTDAEGILFSPNGPRGKYRPELEDSAVFGRAVPRKFYIKPTGWNSSDQLVIAVSGTTAATGTALDGNTQCAGDTVIIKQGDDAAVLTPGLVNRTSGTFSYQVTVTQAAANNTNGVYVEYTPGRADNAGIYPGWLVHWRYNQIAD